MITTPTVLVLGAGASVPYGYPTGAGLTDAIIAKLSHRTSNAVEILLALGVCDRGTILSFANHLRGSTVQSVDAFLENNDEFLDIGKVAIAQALAPLEIEENLITAPNGGHWYEYLFNQMLDAGFDRFKDNELTIITYNYDRSFEHYLYTAFTHLHSCKEQNAQIEQLRAIPVIHLHGHMGLLPWQIGNGGAMFPYGFLDQKTRNRANRRERTAAAILVKMAEDIKIIHEANHDTEEFKLAHTAISKAKRIYFIGFGYGDTNLNRLFPPNVLEAVGKKSADINGSCMGFPPAEYPRVKRHFQSKLGRCLRHLDDDPEARKRDALEFLKHDAPLG